MTRRRCTTEAQWEYACRAGSTGPYAGTGDLDEMGWYDDNSGGSTHPVGQKRPNAWNLYDMHGNVWEWCADGYGYYGGDCTDPMEPASGSDRVIRGGGWSCYAQSCRSANRGYDYPSSNDDGSGFRLCCSEDCTSKMAEPGKKRQPEASRAERGFAEQKPGRRGHRRDDAPWPIERN